MVSEMKGERKKSRDYTSLTFGVMHEAELELEGEEEREKEKESETH